MKRVLSVIAPLAIVIAACDGETLDGGSTNGSELFVRQALAPDPNRQSNQICT